VLRGYFAVTPAGKSMLHRYPIGGLAEYTLAPDANIVQLADNISFETAARLGYICTSFGGLKMAEVGPGSTVVINGVTGTLGYAATAIALGLGAVKIIGIGRNKDRLSQIKAFSPGRIEVCSTEDVDDVPAWLLDITNGCGPDALVDCLGVGGDADATMRLIKTIRRGGKAVLMAGGAEGHLNQTYAEAMKHNVAILGSTWFSPKEIDELVPLMGAGVVDMSFLEHQSFALDDVDAALKAVGDRPGGAVNIVVKPGGK
jgi:threonine dehydrogenase-like Zn-dependent dehydrogenase